MPKRLQKRKENPQVKTCGFYLQEKQKCEIIACKRLICDYKHCTLHKTRKQIVADKKRYGGVQA